MDAVIGSHSGRSLMKPNLARRRTSRPFSSSLVSSASKRSTELETNVSSGSQRVKMFALLHLVHLNQQAIPEPIEQSRNALQAGSALGNKRRTTR
jgi:hypothetical protein